MSTLFGLYVTIGVLPSEDIHAENDKHTEQNNYKYQNIINR